jgi:DNA polymerase-3 subunit delta'
LAWEGVRGHEALAGAFEQAWRRGRLAHAYLFVGPPGIGKRRFALELARALLCESRPEGRLTACGKCPSCLLVDAETHPDLFLLGRLGEKNELGIDALRELLHGFSLRSARGRGKIAILDDADDLSDAAANCFLKTLEEPPPGTVLILIGTSRDRQWPTIVSRCQVVPFAPLSEPLVAEVLRGQELPDSALVPRLLRLSEGSPGQALALADPELWQLRRGLLAGLASSQPDTIGLARQFMQHVEEAGKEAAAQRRRAGLVLKLLVASLLDVLRLNLGGTARLADAEEMEVLRSLASRLEAEQLLQLIDRCLEADEQLGRYVQVVLVVEGLLDALGQGIGAARSAGKG